MVKPFHLLAKVKELVEKCSFSHHHKSVEAVVAAKRQRGVKMDPVQAQGWIRSQLMLLEETDYFNRALLWDDASCIGDVYGKNIEEDNWYIKFWIDEFGELDSISFHPAEWPMTLQTGVNVEEGSVIYDEIKKMWCLRKPKP